MKIFIRNHWKTILFFTLVGLIGGYFTGTYAFKSYPSEIQQQILAQGVTTTSLGIVSAIQSAMYGLVLGAIGIWLSKKLDYRGVRLRLKKQPIIATATISVIGGLAIILPDILFFNSHSQALANSYLNKPSWEDIVAMVLRRCH